MRSIRLIQFELHKENKLREKKMKRTSGICEIIASLYREGECETEKQLSKIVAESVLNLAEDINP